MARRESEVNAFLQGNFAPWRMEGVAEDLEVTGRIPHELAGTYYRNGPNPAFEPPGRYHWFDSATGARTTETATCRVPV